MTDETIFSETKEQPTTTTQPTIPDEVSDLVGEGKKYKDVTTALKALKAAQEHITKIEKENNDFRSSSDYSKESLEIRERELEQLKEQFRSALEKQETKPKEDKPSASSSPVDKQADDGGVDINELVNKALTAREYEAAKTKNKEAVVAAMLSKFGENASSEYYNIGQAWGYSKDEMNRLAETNPKAVFKMFDIEPKQTQSRNTQASAYKQIPKNHVRKVDWNNDKDVMAYMQEKRQAITAKYN